MDTSRFPGGTNFGGMDIIGGDKAGPACIRLMMFSQTDRNYSEITVAISSILAPVSLIKITSVGSILTLVNDAL